MSRTPNPNSMAILYTRLNTNDCALIFKHGRHGISNGCLLAFYPQNKGALLGILALLRAQLLVRRRVLVKSVLFIVFSNMFFAQK
jgi:hypothetical protein